MVLQSEVIITNEPHSVIDLLLEQKSDEIFTIIDSEDKEFLVEHATEAITKAFISSEVKEFILLVAPRFSVISQNRLLKIIEEPPKNKYFILITKSKSSILPTIKSRLPVRVIHDYNEDELLDLDIENLNLSKVYEFLQTHNKLSNKECKLVVEKIAKKVMKSSRYIIDESLLKLFSDSIKALEVGSPSSFVLTALLLKVLEKKIHH